MPEREYGPQDVNEDRGVTKPGQHPAQQVDPNDPLYGGPSEPTITVPNEDLGGNPPSTDAQGSSGDLPDEYKPYSDIPWQNIPEESRSEVLAGVKKMHGGMTQQQQEIAELRKRSEMLDELVNKPWVQKAWQEQQSQGPAQNNQAAQQPNVDLNENLDPETAKAIDYLVNQRVQQIVGPLQSQMQSLQTQATNVQVKNDLTELRKLADKNNWPSPDSRLKQMYALLNEGKVKDLTTAYRESIFDDLPDMVKKQVQQNANQKVASSIPPGNNSPAQMTQGEFSGDNAVASALNQSIRELQKL